MATANYDKNTIEDRVKILLNKYKDELRNLNSEIQAKREMEILNAMQPKWYRPFAISRNWATKISEPEPLDKDNWNNMSECFELKGKIERCEKMLNFISHTSGNMIALCEKDDNWIFGN